MKLYFSDIDKERCHLKDDLIAMMKIQGLSEIKISLAVPDLGQGYFYCTYYGSVGTVEGSGCGKDCDHYKPRNGKNGRCCHSGYCYIPGKESVLKLKTKNKKHASKI